MELHLGNGEHFKEYRLNHIFSQLCHKIFSVLKNIQIYSNILPEAGWKRAEESEAIPIYNNTA